MTSFLVRQFWGLPLMQSRLNVVGSMSGLVTSDIARRILSTSNSREVGESKRVSTHGGPRSPVNLEEDFERLLKVKQQQLKALRAEGSTSLGSITIEQTLGGMRSLPSLVCETSDLHAEMGIRIRGLSVKELLEKLPKASGSEVPMSEAILWLLLTGEIPTHERCMELQKELTCPERKQLSPAVLAVVDAMPPDSHPMSQLIAAVATASSESIFADAYRRGSMTKAEMWKVALNDGISLLAKLPSIAARIYRRLKGLPLEDPVNVDGMDWAAGFVRLMGFNSPETDDLMRLYMLLHSDHEGGNVSAHSSMLVGSALADPYLAFTAAMCGLAGPLHGLANQECLRWLKALREKLGDNFTAEDVRREAEMTLKSGRVIPGYGHAVLRVTDPRFTAQREFASTRLAGDSLFKLLCVCVDVIPKVLEASGKVRNPYPNVDCHSGVLLSHYGIVEENFYTVLFGVARAMGCVSQLVWCRALGLPIERPKSLTLDKLSQILESKNEEASGAIPSRSL